MKNWMIFLIVQRINIDFLWLLTIFHFVHNTNVFLQLFLKSQICAVGIILCCWHSFFSFNVVDNVSQCSFVFLYYDYDDNVQ